MPEDRVPLFVRLPREQAAALDRMVDSTGRRKQHLVSQMLADQLAVGPGQLSVGSDRRAVGSGQLAVGHIEIMESAGAEEVLTLQEAAALLRLPVETVIASAIAGDLPGRAFGDEWRFARAALLAWLAGSEAAHRDVAPRTGGGDE